MFFVYRFILTILFTEYILHANEIDPYEYLQSYGYATEENTDHGILSLSADKKKEAKENMIKAYQRFRGLKVTGVLDAETNVSMTRLRCDIGDTALSKQRSSINSPAQYLWDKKLRTYRIGSFASYQQMSRLKQESIIDDAFHEWSKHVPLIFEKACEVCSADIVVDFVDDESGKHYDNNQIARFKPTSLAHASYPMDSYPAYVHLNKKILFTDSFTSISSPNLFHIILHEIGHTLGLEHVPGDTNSVMYPDYHVSALNRTRKDYLSTVDQGYIQIRYGKRETSIINSCSRWSTKPEYLSINARNSMDFFLKDFIRKHRQWRSIAFDRIRQSQSQMLNKLPDSKQSSNANNKKLKISGRLIENELQDIQVIFFDESDNLYVSDYSSNSVLKYELIKNKPVKKTIVAENLNAPRAIYVTNDGIMLYVVDSKGVHRFKLDRDDGNIGAATLLFQLRSSSEIYNMVVDETDFHTIYLYDISRQRIEQCRAEINTWNCKKIIQVTNNDYSLIKQSTMLFDHEGNLLFIDESGSTIVLYKHVRSACSDISTAKAKSKKPSTVPRVIKTKKPPKKQTSLTPIQQTILPKNKVLNNTIYILECKETIKVLNSTMHTVDYNGNNQQKWVFIQQSDGTYLIRNLASPFVLTPDSRRNRIYMDYYIKNKSLQKWKLLQQNDGSYIIENVLYKRVLTSSVNDTIRLNVIDKTDNQKWFFQMPSVFPHDNMIAILRSKQTNQVLGSGNNRHVYSHNYNGNNNQKWIFHQQHDGSYAIRNLDTSFLLDVNQNTLWTETLHNGRKQQKWFVNRQADGSYRLENSVYKNILSTDSFWFFQQPSLQPYHSMIVSIRNKKTNRVLMNYYGASLHMYDYNGDTHQKWKFSQYDDDEYFVIENIQTGFVLDADNSYAYALEFNESYRQKWKAIRQNDGSYVLQNYVNSYALGSSTHSNVYPQPGDNNDYQKWFFESI